MHNLAFIIMAGILPSAEAQQDDSGPDNEDELCMEIPFGQVPVQVRFPLTPCCVSFRNSHASMVWPLFGPTKVENRKHFIDILNEKETVQLKREEGNIYESSAIRVENVMGVEVHHHHHHRHRHHYHQALIRVEWNLLLIEPNRTRVVCHLFA